MHNAGRRSAGRNRYRCLVALTKPMKQIASPLLAVRACLAADWIQPPAHTASGYPVPQPDVAPVLPGAHAMHPGYGIEWWYWVGHLESSDSGKEYGFQSTVFRIEGAAGATRLAQQPVFGDQQLFMAHTALSDIQSGRYHHAERIYREGWQARASTERSISRSVAYARRCCRTQRT